MTPTSTIQADRTALVTGGGSRIGKAIAAVLAPLPQRRDRRA
jgi:NAD(P)-dependent dehydrogenase (short-subunit alcohol dehydrogenase family)